MECVKSEDADWMGLLDAISARLRAPWMLVGATARDLLVAEHMDVRLRATWDIDVAVKVSSWENYEAYRWEIVSSYLAEADPRVHHRMSIVPSGPTLDLLPFGEIADEEGDIVWPDASDKRMSVAACGIACEYAVEKMWCGRPIRIPSLPGYSLMKLCTWHHAPSRGKDLEDFLFVLGHYADLVDEERVFGEGAPDADVLGVQPFDIRLAGARLLGRDMGRMLHTSKWPRLLSWLEGETVREKLLFRLADLDRSLAGDTIDGLIGHLWQGIVETRP